jgi:hypothetical protein
LVPISGSPASVHLSGRDCAASSSPAGLALGHLALRHSHLVESVGVDALGGLSLLVQGLGSGDVGLLGSGIGRGLTLRRLHLLTLRHLHLLLAHGVLHGSGHVAVGHGLAPELASVVLGELAHLAADLRFASTASSGHQILFPPCRALRYFLERVAEPWT